MHIQVILNLNHIIQMWVFLCLANAKAEGSVLICEYIKKKKKNSCI